jgi:hypothetical protein
MKVKPISAIFSIPFKKIKKSVLYHLYIVPAPKVFRFLGCLVREEAIYYDFACFYENIY